MRLSFIQHSRFGIGSACTLQAAQNLSVARACSSQEFGKVYRGVSVEAESLHRRVNCAGASHAVSGVR